MAKNSATAQGKIKSVGLKPIDGGGVLVDVHFQFVAKGAQRKAQDDFVGMIEHNMEVSATKMQGELPYEEGE